jgi:glucose-6-phosphate-specific signal transduction histidine kinase
LYILIYMFLAEDKRFWTEWQQALPEFSLLLISSWIKFWSVTLVSKYLNCVTFWKRLLPIFMSLFCSTLSDKTATCT